MIEYIVIFIVGLALGAGVGLMIKGKAAANKVKDAEAEAAKIIANAERAFGSPPVRWPSPLHLLPAPAPDRAAE